MRLFFAFLVLCFLGGMFASPTKSEGRLRWYLAGLCLVLAVALFVFREF